MEICSGKRPDYHEDIVYEGRNCPLCTAIEEYKILQGEKEELENRKE